MTKRAAALAAVGALLLVSIPGSGLAAATAQPPAVVTGKPRLAAQGEVVPVAAGPLVGVTTEYGYNAFPAVVTPASGRILLAYGSAAGHNGPLSDWTLRRSRDGRAWSAPEIVPMPVGGYAYGPSGGIAAETAGQGGRIYLTLQRAHWPAKGSKPDEQRYWLYTSDDDATSWQRRQQFPTTPGTWGVGPSSLLVLADGSVVMAGYSSDGVVRFMSSTDRGETMKSAGSVTVAGRQNGNPQLGQLPDGRVFVIFRSDLTGAQSRYYYAFRSGPSSWSAPALLFPDATTLSGVTVLSDRTIAILYRGWSDRTSDGPQFRPLRVMLAGVSGSGLAVWRSNVDLNPALRARFLGGRIIRNPSGGDLAVWGIEGPLTTATAAQIVSQPVEFLQSP
jgi:hypothetical protein